MGILGPGMEFFVAQAWETRLLVCVMCFHCCCRTITRNMEVVLHTIGRQQRLLSSELCIQEYAANITFYVCNSWMLTHRPERFRKASFGDQSNPLAAMLCVIK
jgi:hypothetical protein